MNPRAAGGTCTANGAGNINDVVNLPVGGSVTYSATCPIDPAAVDPEDVELLQDVIVAAVNEAMRAAQELAQSRLGTVAGGLSGLGIPGL